MAENSKIEGFIKDYDMIQEDWRVEDLLDFSEDIATFSKKLDSIEKPSIIGLVGKFGIGKSTMLYQIQRQREKTEKWINFDAWKYPDRKDLWEGFVLDFADQIGEKKKTLKRMNGKTGKNFVMDAAAEIGSKLPIPAKSFTDLFKSAPATRVFDIQEILSGIINKQNSNIVIVIEDIDRSGDAGIYFMETLKQFVRDNNFKNNIVAIIPMGDANYLKYRDSYIKSLDYIEFFHPSIKEMNNFVESIFKEESLQIEHTTPELKKVPSNIKKQLISFFEELLKQPNITIRHLKTILRKSDLIFKNQMVDGHFPDCRVTICFEASKYICKGLDNDELYFDEFERTRIIQSNTLFATFLLVIMKNWKSIYKPIGSDGEKRIVTSDLDFKCITRKGARGIDEYPSIPWHYNPNYPSEQGYGVCDFYLNY